MAVTRTISLLGLCIHSCSFSRLYDHLLRDSIYSERTIMFILDNFIVVLPAKDGTRLSVFQGLEINPENELFANS